MKEEISAEIGRNLKKYREINNLTQDQLSEMIGIDVNYYSMCERGERRLSLPKIMKAIEIFKVSPNDVFPDDHDEKIYTSEYLKQISNIVSELPEEKLYYVLKFCESIE